MPLHTLSGSQQHKSIHAIYITMVNCGDAVLIVVSMLKRYSYEVVLFTWSWLGIADKFSDLFQYFFHFVSHRICVCDKTFIVDSSLNIETS